MLGKFISFLALLALMKLEFTRQKDRSSCSKFRCCVSKVQAAVLWLPTVSFCFNGTTHLKGVALKYNSGNVDLNTQSLSN
jgi:hypothetical protein